LIEYGVGEGSLLGDVESAAGVGETTDERATAVGETTDDGLLVTGLQAVPDTTTAAAVKINLSALFTD
jgi:hypothetical protein